MIAQGRGEAFDYLLGEQSGGFAISAARAAAAQMLLATKVVISINGNTAMLVPDEMISLSKATGSLLEVNLFHDSPKRRKLIGEHFKKLGANILGITPDAKVDGLSSDRANVDSEGIKDADVVIVSLEDGDRTEALIRNGKKVIAIDLNPLSRTPQQADISIIDNVIRALPEIERQYNSLKSLSESEISSILGVYDNKLILQSAEDKIRTPKK